MKTEEKAKAYDKALERARNAYQNIKPEYTAVKAMLEEAFPELRESEDERVRKAIKCYVEDMPDTYGFAHGIGKKEMLSYLEKQKEQKPAWSEEDEEMLSGFLHKLEVCDLLSNKENAWIVRKLKSLRPQPEAEWSEEDEQIRDNIICVLQKDVTYTPPTRPNSCTGSGNAFYTHQTEIDWLKSLRPSWKPSEEHLSALLAVFNDPDNIGSATCQLALTDLYEQLKKLMED